jgi:hypothetical protein
MPEMRMKGFTGRLHHMRTFAQAAQNGVRP